MTRPHLAITMVDPAGIGPEIIIKAREKLRPRIEASDLRLSIIGSGAALKKTATQLRAKVDISEMRAADKEWPKPCIFRADDEGRADQAGRAISRPLRKASEQGVRLSQAERGIVTAPLNKAGYHYPGHTEMLAELAASEALS